MKKYDLYICGTYVTIILIALIFIFYNYKMRMHLQEEVKDLFDSPPISKVEINDFHRDMIVVTVDKVPENREDWCMFGFISTDKLKSLRIEDNTLYVTEFRGHIDALYVKEGITVKLNNSPDVKFMTHEEYEKFKEAKNKKR